MDVTAIIEKQNKNQVELGIMPSKHEGSFLAVPKNVESMLASGNYHMHYSSNSFKWVI